MKTVEAEQKELITIYMDVEYEETKKEEIEAFRKDWQEQVNKFKAMDLGEINSHDELIAIISNPHEFILKRWADRVEAPAMFDKDRYLNLLIKPDTSEFKILHWIRHDMFYLERWEIKINEQVTRLLIEARNFSLEKDSHKHKVYKSLVNLEKTLNETMEAMGSTYFSIKNDESIGKLFAQQDEQWHRPAKLSLDQNKVKNFLKERVR